jgi:hypothetical protein
LIPAFGIYRLRRCSSDWKFELEDFPCVLAPKKFEPQWDPEEQCCLPTTNMFMETTMKKSPRYGRADNRPHQNRLANMLVHEVGFDEAVNLCIRNGWDGTLSMLKFGSPK